MGISSETAAAAIRAVFATERIAPADCAAILPDYLAIADWLLAKREAGSAPLVLGICGAQGSGKTTLAGAVAQALRSHGTATALLSLDDLYLTRAERRRLAREVHPLFATRGVPGTHDVALGLATLDSLARGDAAELPRFDKAADDRAPRQQWDRAPERTRVVLFEGWCVGAMPQGEDALIAPVNVLEASEDAQGIWRRHANHALAGPYAALFGRIGLLVLLAAPGFKWCAGGVNSRKRNCGSGPGRMHRA